MTPEQFAVALRQMETGFKRELEDVRRQIEVVRNDSLDLESLAGKRNPYRLQIDIDVPIGSAALLTGTRTLSRSGPFVAKRLYAAFRIKTLQASGAADWVGRYLPLSSRETWNVMQMWKVNVAPLEETFDPPLDFVWGYSDGVSDRERQNQFIAGDILARHDEDGFLAISEVFAGGAAITFQMQPLRAVGNAAPWNHGTTGVALFEFSVIFEGYRILQPMVA